MTQGISTDVRSGFLEAMSRLAATVVMVTTWVEGKPWGLTISSCCSVSVEPPLLLVSLAAETTSAKSILDGQVFGVSILGERLVDTARFGAAKGAAKFVEEFCDADTDRVQDCVTPVVAGAIAHLDCALEQQLPIADHIIFVGRVRNVLLSATDEPLLYHGRRYRRLGSWDIGHPYQGW